MPVTPRQLTHVIRVAGMLAAIAALAALTGPIRYRDLGLPFPDFVAHGMLFYGLAGLMMGALPRSRTTDMAVALVLLAGLSEVLQGIVGRDMEWSDFVGDSVGVLAATAPVYLAGFRRLAREHPDATLAELRAMDRRKGRPAEQQTPEAAQG